MKKTLRILAMLAVAVTVIFAAASSASANPAGIISNSESDGFTLMSDNNYTYIEGDISYTATTSSFTVSWTCSIPQNMNITEWMLVYDDEGILKYIDKCSPDTRSFKENIADFDIETTGEYISRFAIGFTYTDSSGIQQYGLINDYADVFTKFAKSDFCLVGSDNMYSFEYAQTLSSTGGEIEIRTASGTLVKRCDSKDSFAFPQGKAYKYRIRPYVTDSSGSIITGPWSSYRYACNPYAQIKYSSLFNGCNLKLKGVSKVQKYKVYVSTSINKRGSLTKTLTPKTGVTSTYRLNKIGKYSMKSGKRYYITIVPVISGYESDISGIVNFYNTYY